MLEAVGVQTLCVGGLYFCGSSIAATSRDEVVLP
jgi:hypothetical protein